MCSIHHRCMLPLSSSQIHAKTQLSREKKQHKQNYLPTEIKKKKNKRGNFTCQVFQNKRDKFAYSKKYFPIVCFCFCSSFIILAGLWWKKRENFVPNKTVNFIQLRLLILLQFQLECNFAQNEEFGFCLHLLHSSCAGKKQYGQEE